VNISLALLVVFFSQFIVCLITDTFRITLPILVHTDKLLQFVVHILALVMSQQPINWSCNWTTPLTHPCDCLLLNLIKWPLSLLPNFKNVRLTVHDELDRKGKMWPWCDLTLISTSFEYLTFFLIILELKFSIFFKRSQLVAHYFVVYLFQLLYMFRATMCPSSGKLTVSMRHWYFSLCMGGCLVCCNRPDSHLVGFIWKRLYRDARSTKHKRK